MTRTEPVGNSGPESAKDRMSSAEHVSNVLAPDGQETNSFLADERAALVCAGAGVDGLSPRLARMYGRFANGTVSASHMVATTGILRAVKIVTIRVEVALAAFDLTMSQFEILGLLNAAPGGSLAFSEIKKDTLLHPATLTYTADVLEKRKLIVRVPSPSDRRALNAKITRTGRALTGSAIEALDKARFGLGEWDSEEALDAAIQLSKLHVEN